MAIGSLTVIYGNTLILLQENVSLIKEINDLRKELKIVRVKNHDLEAALGLHRKNNKDVSQLLQAVTSQNKNAMMEEDLKEKGKVCISYIKFTENFFICKTLLHIIYKVLKSSGLRNLRGRCQGYHF